MAHSSREPCSALQSDLFHCLLSTGLCWGWAMQDTTAILLSGTAWPSQVPSDLALGTLWCWHGQVW